MSTIMASFREMMGGLMGSHPYVIELGGYSALGTNGAGLLTLSTMGTTSSNQQIPLAMSYSGYNFSSEYSAIIALFDEFKCEAVKLQYEPYNPFNRGSSVNSDSFAFIYDDENEISAFTSDSALNVAANRGQDRFVRFSPDHSFRHTFRRPLPMSQYSWSKNSADSGDSLDGLDGTIALGYNSSSLSISTRYGTLNWTYLIHARMRI